MQERGGEVTSSEFHFLLNNLEAGEVQHAGDVLADVIRRLDETGIPLRLHDQKEHWNYIAALLIRYGITFAPEAEITMTFRNKDAARMTMRFFQDIYNQDIKP